MVLRRTSTWRLESPLSNTPRSATGLKETTWIAGRGDSVLLPGHTWWSSCTHFRRGQMLSLVCVCVCVSWYLLPNFLKLQDAWLYDWKTGLWILYHLRSLKAYFCIEIKKKKTHHTDVWDNREYLASKLIFHFWRTLNFFHLNLLQRFILNTWHTGENRFLNSYVCIYVYFLLRFILGFFCCCCCF